MLECRLRLRAVVGFIVVVFELLDVFVVSTRTLSVAVHDSLFVQQTETRVKIGEQKADQKERDGEKDSAISQNLIRPTRIATVISKERITIISLGLRQVDKENQNSVRDELLDHEGPNAGKETNSAGELIAELHDVAEAEFVDNALPRPHVGLGVHALLEEEQCGANKGEVYQEQGDEATPDSILLTAKRYRREKI